MLAMARGTVRGPFLFLCPYEVEFCLASHPLYHRPFLALCPVKCILEIKVRPSMNA